MLFVWFIWAGVLLIYDGFSMFSEIPFFRFFAKLFSYFMARMSDFFAYSVSLYIKWLSQKSSVVYHRLLMVAPFVEVQYTGLIENTVHGVCNGQSGCAINKTERMIERDGSRIFGGLGCSVLVGFFL